MAAKVPRVNGAGCARQVVVNACAAMVEVTDTTGPGPGAGAYDAAYDVYRGLYPALRASFTALAAV